VDKDMKVIDKNMSLNYHFLFHQLEKEWEL